MENITNTIKETMQKTYSFTGTQLALAGVSFLLIILIITCAGGRHDGPRGMMRGGMERGGRSAMMQDRQGNTNNQSARIMNRKQAMMDNQNNNPSPNPETNGQQTPPAETPITTNTSNASGAIAQ